MIDNEMKHIFRAVLLFLFAGFLSGCGVSSEEQKREELKVKLERKYLEAIERQVLHQKVKRRSVTLETYEIKELDQDVTLVGPVNKRFKKETPYTRSQKEEKRGGSIQSYGARAGFAVSSGDFNGDGYDDIVLSAPYSDAPLVEGKRAGALYIVYGSKEVKPVIDLEYEADVTLLGGDISPKGAILGHAIGSGDINGDGIDDLVIGAPLSHGRNNLEYTGAVYILYGHKGWAGVYTIENDADAVLYGKQKFDRLGYSLAIDDFNGDGVDDLALSAPGVKGDEVDAPANGVVYMLYSSAVGYKGEYRAADLASSDIVNVHSVISSYFQEDVRSFFGFSFGTSFIGTGSGRDISVNRYGIALGSGDFNGDGIADLAVGSPYSDGFQDAYHLAGEVNLFYGRGRAFSQEMIDARSGADVTIYGEIPTSLTGYTLSSGDFDGDGYDDLFIGSPMLTDQNISPFRLGLVSVLRGRAHQKRYLSISNGMDMRIRGTLLGAKPDSLWSKMFGDIAESIRLSERRDSYFGYALASGDINGDGKDDLIVGAPGYSTKRGTPILSGAAYIFLGHEIKETDISSLKADVTVLGRKRDGRTGFSVSFGDINGDNIDDVIVGSPDSNTMNKARRDAGEVAVIFGHFKKL